MLNPSISVITAVYNARDTIEATIASVLAQTYDNIEFIIVDGASSDGTVEILNAQPGVDVLISEPDNGIYDALNKGIAHAHGDIIGFLHADDLFASDHVLQDIAATFVDRNVDVIYGDLEYVSKAEPGQVVRYWQSGDFSEAKLRHGWMPPHPTFYVSKSVYEQYGGFDTAFRIAADYDCMLRLLGRATLRVAYIPRVLVKMRVGGESNRSLSNIMIKSKEDYLALKRNGIGGVGALVWKNLSKIPQFFRRSTIRPN